MTQIYEGQRERVIDLHSHTTESDGTFSPDDLVRLASESGLTALGITDHDTFSGYEKALPAAKTAGLELVRGIELNSRLNLQGSMRHRSVHLLAYFPVDEPKAAFLDWLEGQRAERRDRNRRLATALQDQQIDITLEEVEARGRTLAGRTHFAQILLEKGYVHTFEEAFTKYLGENAPTHVERQSQTTEQTIDRIRSGGGIATVAHPVRLSLPRDVERQELIRLKAAGLLALEVFHSDHSAELQAYYQQLAKELALIPTGGSDFHGAVKRSIQLGTGTAGNLRVPYDFLDGLRQLASLQ